MQRQFVHLADNNKNVKIGLAHDLEIKTNLVVELSSEPIVEYMVALAGEVVLDGAAIRLLHYLSLYATSSIFLSTSTCIMLKKFSIL